MRKMAFVLAFLVAGLTFGQAVAGEARGTVYLLTTAGELVSAALPGPAAITARSPLVISSTLAITNITAGETLVAIDVRPQTQHLYGLGVNATANTATLYHISPETGFAGVVHTSGLTGQIAFTTDGMTPVDFADPSVVGWDIDFNPSVDRLRVVAGSLTFRVNPNTGLPVDGDNGGASGSVSGTNPDGAINGGTTNVNAAAYTNNQPNNGSITTLYTLDSVTNSLYIQNPPNAGTQTSGIPITLGGNPVDFTIQCGFDILPGVNVASSNAAVTSGIGYAVLTTGGGSALFSIDLVTGALRVLGFVPPTIRSMCMRTELGAVIAIGDETKLLRFNPATPGTVTSVNLTGIVSGEKIAGSDWRPQTGQYMALGINGAANTGTLYLVDPQTAALSVVGTASQIAFVDAAGSPVDLPDPSNGPYEIDFNPTVDRLRVTTFTGLNFRINPNTGAAVDGNLNSGTPAGTNTDGLINGSSSTGISGAAYTRNFAQSLTGGTTTLYTIDATQSKLFIQTPANSGTQTSGVTVRYLGDPLTLPGAYPVAFDIPSSIGVPPEAWFASTFGVANFYRFDLTFGDATLIGAIGTGITGINGLSVFNTASMNIDYPSGTQLLKNTGLIGFGSTFVGVPVTKTFTISNPGSQTLTYSVPTSSPVSVTNQTASGVVYPGGSVDVDLTYTPTAPGLYDTTLIITSSDVSVQTFEIALVGVAINPVTVDSIGVFPNPSFVDVSNAFTIAVTPSNSTVAWNFGDGTSGTGTSPKHIYGNAGTYTVTATATDPGTGSMTSKTLTVVVSAIQSGSSATIAGTQSLDVVYGRIRTVPSQGLQIQGFINIATPVVQNANSRAFNFTNVPVTLSINGFTRTFKLNKQGHAVLSDARFGINPVAKNSKVGKFEAYSNAKTLTTNLATNVGLDTSGRPKVAVVIITLDTVTSSAVIPLTYLPSKDKGFVLFGVKNTNK
ncbi:MAG: DUF4394 domain-containing protein [Planctomycetota bacterium]